MTTAQIKFLETDPAMISAETTLRVAASDVYALIADPARHTELDGGGSVRGLISGGTPELREGDSFTEKMFLGLPYRMSPKVVRAEKNQILSWRMPTGHYWTWEIADNHDGTVTVRENRRWPLRVRCASSQGLRLRRCGCGLKAPQKAPFSSRNDRAARP